MRETSAGSALEHQPMDVLLGSLTFALVCRQAHDPPRLATEARLMLGSPRACRDGTRGRSARLRSAEGRAGGGIAMRAYRVILRVVFWVILSVVLVAASFWVYAIVTGGKNF
jgi:hypothetical protein